MARNHALPSFLGALIASGLIACGSDPTGTEKSSGAGQESSPSGGQPTTGGTSTSGSGGTSSAGTSPIATAGSDAGGSSPSGGSAASAGGTGSSLELPAGYSSWIGFQAPDEVVATGDQVPVAASDCPEDPDMVGALVVFANSADGVSDALSFDWTHNYGGWHAAVVGPPSGTLAVALADPNAKLVYWIKGSSGGEEGMFLLRLNYGDGSNSTELWPPEVPGPVTTGWTKMEIPVTSFSGGTDNTSGVGSVGTGNSHSAGHAAYLIDNVYFTSGE